MKGNFDGAFGSPGPVGCIFCGDKKVPGSCWHGSTDIFVCYQCIREGMLGRLIGDAIADHNCSELDYGTVHQVLERLLTATEKEALYTIIHQKDMLKK